MAKKVPKEEKKGAVKAAEKRETKVEKTASTAKTDSVKSKMKKGKDPWKVIVYPHLAEKSMNMVEFDNKLTFIVRRTASKKDIKEAIENLFDVRVLKVQTEVTPKGVKKAYAKLSPDSQASEIASRLGMV